MADSKELKDGKESKEENDKILALVREFDFVPQPKVTRASLACPRH